jgi:hypothetical protein
MLRRFLPAEEIEPSHIFMLFYTVALVADFDQNLTQPSGWIVIALSVWVALSLTRASFLVLLATSTLYFIFKELPDTENHTNLLVITNIGMMLCLVHSYTRERGGSAAVFYEVAQPIARLSIIAALAVAGFHKFNRDFINPDVSCVRRFARDIGDVVVGDFAGIGLPPLFFLALMVVIVVVMLWRQRPNLCWPPIDWVGVATPIAAILVGIGLLSTVVGDPQIYEPRDLAVFFLAVAVLCWQLIEVPLLLVPRFQWVALSFCLLVHVQLAVLRIVDFQAIAVALLITFVPPHMWQAWSRQAFASIGPVKLHRARLYFMLNLLIALMMFAQEYGIIDWGWSRPLTAWGLLFTAGLLVMLWPIISDLCSPARTWQWKGVPVFSGATPRWLYVIPLVVLLFGLTSHFGLRTAGNLSIYSNLRTEAGHNNHFLLGNNQFKWASYQEDVVHIVDIGDDATIRPFLDRWGRLEGNMLPVIEFRKLLLKWRKRGETVPMTVGYNGVVKEWANIAQSPDWQVNDWDWEMRLMDFRVIQSDGGPNTCRW